MHISIKKIMKEQELFEITKMTISDLMSTICTIATLKYYGHFTILSFTNHYKGGFGTITEREDIEKLKGYDSLRELLIDMIIN
ncbi:hypothetical protein UFOVP775_13 [uncultured Caudovirales phage]|uniref:Uncharacterized protein n=1 Tax=uncultured Caudovirales phage TaxID=2100421 RepID=A0A6J5P3N0_9CAUD|nr:hypothetical protein UFOVP775_13 [uncultured Caudovirales phage]